jgi:hypothetical protein
MRMAAPPPRRRARRGSLERPISGRIYRAAWLVAAVPLLVAAFSLGTPVALQEPRLPPSFDGTTALQFAREFTRLNADRRPGTSEAQNATEWVAARLSDYKFTVERQEFTADVPGLGQQRFVNLIATAPLQPEQDIARSRQTIVIMAHRDNLGLAPGGVDNGSGTGALLELARDIGNSSLAHSVVLISEDGGAYGSLGAAEFVANSALAERVAAVINLDAIGSPAHPRIEFAGETSRTPISTLVATAESAIAGQAGVEPSRASAGEQLVDLAFPFTLYGQGAFIARGIPAVTFTTARSLWGHARDDRPETPRRARSVGAGPAGIARRGRGRRPWHRFLCPRGLAPHSRVDDPVLPPDGVDPLPGRRGRPLRALSQEAHPAAARAPEPAQPSGAVALDRSPVPLLLGHRDAPGRGIAADRARHANRG